MHLSARASGSSGDTPFRSSCPVCENNHDSEGDEGRETRYLVSKDVKQNAGAEGVSHDRHTP